MSTTTTKLINPTDDELSAAVAERILKWKRCKTELHAKFGGWLDANKQFMCYGDELPPFATSADAVLPLLEKYASFTVVTSDSACIAERYSVIISDNGCMAFGPIFARAGSIALLRANGIEVEQTATR